MYRGILSSTRIIDSVLGGAGLASLLAAGFTWGAIASAGETKVATTATNADGIKRGAQSVATGGCNDCHTPLKNGPQGPEPDLSRLLSGHPETVQLPPPPILSDGAWTWVGSATNTAFAGPWGITYAINLTPDKETGLGAWTEAMFVGALKTGKHMGTSRPIMPPMPWIAYSHFSEEDLKAMFAYLQTIPPIHNRVPAYAAPVAAKQ